MKVHIYINADDLIELNKITNGEHIIMNGPTPPIQYYNTPKAYKHSDNIIEISLTSEDFIRLIDRNVFEKIELIQN